MLPSSAVIVIVAMVVILLIVVILHNLLPSMASTLLHSVLLGGRGGVVVAILADRKVKEIYGAMLGLHHVGEALLLKLHLTMSEDIELLVGFSLPFGRVHGQVG